MGGVAYVFLIFLLGTSWGVATQMRHNWCNHDAPAGLFEVCRFSGNSDAPSFICNMYSGIDLNT